MTRPGKSCLTNAEGAEKKGEEKNDMLLLLRDDAEGDELPRVVVKVSFR
jgi:hypothetical protein